MNTQIVEKFKYDKEYTREQIALIARPADPPTGGDWYTGYSRIEDLLYVFLNIDSPGRTGHDFDNYYDKRTQTLLWFGKPGSKSSHPLLQDVINGAITPLFFSRSDNRDPFSFLGVGTIIRFHDNHILADNKFCLKMIVSIDGLDEMISPILQSDEPEALSHESENNLTNTQLDNNHIGHTSEDNQLKIVIDYLINLDSIESVHKSDRRLKTDISILERFTKIQEELLYHHLENLRELEPWHAFNENAKHSNSVEEYDPILDRSVDVLDLTVRPSNCLRHEGIKLIGELVKKTKYELLRIPNMGKNSLLEIEDVLSSHNLALGMIPEDWNNQNLLPEERILKDLTNALLSIKHKLGLIEKMSFKEQLFDPIKISPPPSEERKYAVAQRYGINGSQIDGDVESVLTLEQIGKQLGVTRERIRQLQNKTEKAILSSRFWMPKLEELFYVLEGFLPISEEKLITYLEDNGYGYYTIRALQKISELYQIEFPFVVKIIKGKKFLTTEAFSEINEVSVLASKLCSKTGFVQTHDLSEYLEQSGLKYHDYNPDIVKRNLIEVGNFTQLDESWFSSKDIARNRFENVIRLMAHCINPINIKDVREGMKRAFSYRKDLQKKWPWLLAPSHIMLEYCRLSPYMNVSENGDVYVQEEFLEQYRFAKTFRQMRDIIKAQPNEVIDFRAFQQGGIVAGINPTTFNMYCTFQPFIERFAPGVWGLRGSKPSPASIEAVREYSKQAPRKKRKLIEHFNDDGNIEIITRISAPHNFLLQVNLETASNLGNEKYMLQSIGGRYFGEIQHVPSNQCIFPLGKGLSKIGAEEDDFIKITFDLTTNIASIELVPESIIWEYDD